MRSTTTETIKPHTYKQLDGLRGLAALTVFFAHFSKMKIDITNVDLLTRGTIGILVNGTAAVIFFFVLSGFVLSLPYVNNKAPLKLTSFYLKRVFRIYPALIISIMLCVLLKEVFFNNTHSFIFSSIHKDFWTWELNYTSFKEIIKTCLLIGPNFDVEFLNPPIWSLVVEMKMSLLLPVFILITARNSTILNTLLFFILCYLTFKHGAWQINLFYIGVLLSKYKDQLILKISSWHPVFFILISITAFILYNNNFIFLDIYRQLRKPFDARIAGYLIAISSAIIIIVVLSMKRVSAFFEKKIFSFLGAISYSFYLIHFPILFTIASFLYGKYNLSTVYIFICSLIITTIMSYLIFIFIEQPFKKCAVYLIKKYKALNALTV